MTPFFPMFSILETDRHFSILHKLGQDIKAIYYYSTSSRIWKVCSLFHCFKVVSNSAILLCCKGVENCTDIDKVCSQVKWMPMDTVNNISTEHCYPVSEEWHKSRKHKRYPLLPLSSQSKTSAGMSATTTTTITIPNLQEWPIKTQRLSDSLPPSSSPSSNSSECLLLLPFVHHHPIFYLLKNLIAKGPSNWALLLIFRLVGDHSLQTLHGQRGGRLLTYSKALSSSRVQSLLGHI